MAIYLGVQLSWAGLGAVPLFAFAGATLATVTIYSLAQVGGKTMSIQTGKIAKQANGSVVVTYGETQVLAGLISDEERRAANKVPGAYCALASDCYSARMARLHNGANLLALGGRTLGPELARELVRVFLTTEPSGEERHQRRRAKIADLERS